jgi:arylsulfatase A-like enzyme
VQAIEDMGLADDTLIFYLYGDNGASMEGTENETFNEMTTLNGRSLLRSWAWWKRKQMKVRFGSNLIIDTELLGAAKVTPLLNEANEIVAIMASSKKMAVKSQIANRKSEIR